MNCSEVMSRILIIEDEPDMQFVLSDNLQAEGYEVGAAGTGRDGIRMLLGAEYDLVLLDLMLPDVSGFDVCKSIRAEDPRIPIIILTAKGEEIDKVVGLELGANDYVTKPFGMRELLARVKAAIRTSSQALAEPPGECVIGGARVDFSRGEVEREGAREKLTRYESELLQYLAAHRGRVVSRERILEEVWGRQADSSSRSVDNYVARVRTKIEENPSRPRHLLTVHGEGYKLL
jgi:DNA-binding response OmpR family regulator